MTAPLFDIVPAVVEVNECRVLGTTVGAQWWSDFMLAHPASRFTIVTSTPGGAIVHVACHSRADAAWLAGHMVEHAGLPKSAVRVPKARAS